jgi:RNA polymerase sigma-70 factor (ECF subfamily)
MALTTPELGEALERHRVYLRLLAGVQLQGRLKGKLEPSDLVQQTLLKAYQARHQFQGSTSGELACWLRQILARTLANAARDLGRDKRDVALERSLEEALHQSSARLEAWLAADQPSPSEQAQRNEQLLRLSTALAELPEPQRTVVLLKHCQGWSLAEIGQHLGRSRASVASFLRRGLQQLRQHLQSDT